MPHDITVGVDGSPAGLAAAHWAAEEAGRRGTGLGVVHAWNSHPRPAPYVPMDRTEHDWAAEILHEAVRSIEAAHPDLRVTERLVRDSTVAALVAAAADSEMLVLGSRGLGAFSGFVTGAVSQRVVARSPRPVVLVRAAGRPPRSICPPPTGSRRRRSRARRTGRSSSASTPPVPATRSSPSPSRPPGGATPVCGWSMPSVRPSGPPPTPRWSPPRPPPSTRCRTHRRQDRRGRTPNDR